MQYCNKCGTALPDNADFCPNCGTAVPGRAQPISVQRGKNSIAIAAIAAVTVVLVVSIVCFTFFYQSRQEAQLAALAEQQPQAEVQTESDTDSQTDNETDAENTAPAASITNHYYYYGEDAARDNDYYTEVTESGYLWPTDTEYISNSDLRGMSQDTVAAIRNEIYARHGYAFTTTRWQNYFASKTWYNRDSSCTDATIRARLSSIERANISTIVAYEESKGWR